MKYRTMVAAVAAVGLAAAAGRTAVQPREPAISEGSSPKSPTAAVAAAPVVQAPVLGSDTEIFTAALIARLVQSGRISVDDHLGDLLPWYRQDTGALVTVGHLLAHASGIPDHPDVVAGARPWPGATTRDVVHAWCSGDLIAQPGARREHGATEAILLGAIIEEVTGADYARAVCELVLPAAETPTQEGPPPGWEAALDVSFGEPN